MSSSRLRRALVVVSCAGVFVGAGVTAAHAGEITGKGDSLKKVPVVGGGFTLHGKSECAYSGLNDEYVLAAPADKHLYSRVQNPAEAPPGVAGYACNPAGARP